MKKTDPKDITSIEILDVHTFACSGEETLLGVETEYSDNVVLSFSTYQLLKMLDQKYMKEQLTKYLKKL